MIGKTISGYGKQIKLSQRTCDNLRKKSDFVAGMITTNTEPYEDNPLFKDNPELFEFYFKFAERTQTVDFDKLLQKFKDDAPLKKVGEYDWGGSDKKIYDDVESDYMQLKAKLSYEEAIAKLASIGMQFADRHCQFYFIQLFIMKSLNTKEDMMAFLDNYFKIKEIIDDANTCGPVFASNCIFKQKQEVKMKEIEDAARISKEARETMEKGKLEMEAYKIEKENAKLSFKETLKKALK